MRPEPRGNDQPPHFITAVDVKLGGRVPAPPNRLRAGPIKNQVKPFVTVTDAFPPDPEHNVAAVVIVSPGAEAAARVCTPPADAVLIAAARTPSRAALAICTCTKNM